MTIGTMFCGPLLVVATLGQPVVATDAPTGLLCELLDNPSKTAILDFHPEFGWIVHSATPNAMQTAYRVLVASNPDKLGHDIGDLWDSGKVLSGASINVEYQGRELSPGATYFWKVRTWDRTDRTSAWSAFQKFTMHKMTVPYEPAPGEYTTPPGVIQHTRFTVDRDADPDLWWCGTTRYPLTFTEVAPVKVVKTADDRWFVDFGRDGFAYLRLTLTSDADGDEVEIRLGEKAAGASVDMSPGGAIRRVSTGITLQKGTHRYVPRINGNARMPRDVSVIPFRYCEIIGSPVPIDETMLTQVVYHYPFHDNASHFRSSDPTLNDVWKMCKYTIKATSFCGVYVDGDRQRDVLHGDGLINQLGHYCVDREFSMPRYSQEVLTMSRHWSSEWMMCSPLMAWHDYMNTGNTESMAKYYDVLKLKTLYGLARDDGLISSRIHACLVSDWLVDKEADRVMAIDDTSERTKALEALVRGGGIQDRRLQTAKGKEALKRWALGQLDQPSKRNAWRMLSGPEQLIRWSGSRHLIDIIDWPASQRDDYDFVDVLTVPNAMHYGTLRAMRDIAAALGKQDDARFFDQRAKLVKKSINAKLFDENRGIYVDGEGSDHASLHANMFPLAFDIVPECRRARVAAFVKKKGMACSVYGAQFLLEGLYNADQQQAALELLRSRAERSWGHMIYDVGTTIAMEAWDLRFKPNLDWNHPWGAVPANIIPRFLMGIRPLQPGFGRMLIQPKPGDLRYAECTMPTIRGPIGVRLENDPGKSFRLTLDLPANTTAVVGLPLLDNPRATAVEDGKPVEGRIDGRYLFIDTVGSGRHTITRRCQEKAALKDSDYPGGRSG